MLAPSASERVLVALGRNINFSIFRAARFLLSPYFRFDPGPVIGEIELTDTSQLREMGKILWDHMQKHSEVDKRQKERAETLRTASFQPLEQIIEPVRIVKDAMTPSPAIWGWQNISKCWKSSWKIAALLFSSISQGD
jgi:hypothetical protein